MNADELTRAFTALEPSAHRRRRIDARVSEWIDAKQTSLLAEWLRLLRIEPAMAVGLCTVGAVSLVLVSPLGWIVFSVL